MKIIIELNPNEDEDDKDTANWLMDEYKWRIVLNEFTSHMLLKYKHEDPKGTPEQISARLEELEEIKDKFWELVNRCGCNIDFF